MVAIVSVTGAGADGAVGLVSGSDDTAGAVEIRFAAHPWQEQPAASGTVVVRFAGTAPVAITADDGWAILVIHAGDPVVIAWTCAEAPAPGTVQRISYRA